MKTLLAVLFLFAGASAYGQFTPDQPERVHRAGNAGFTNSLGMQFVRIPEGTALFAIWETRMVDYAVFVRDTARSWTQPEFAPGPDHPVVNVTWEDAAAFCDWLTKRERRAGLIREKERYRLPKDAEWSLAVGLALESGKTPEDRMKGAVVWPWGYTWPPQSGDGNYAPDLNTDEFAGTSAAGSFKPNRYGLYDLGGNVWEWCEDWYNSATVTKVLRGASFHDNQPKDLLAAYRFSATMHLSNDDIGFRMVFDAIH